MGAIAYLGYSLTENTYRLAAVADLHRWEVTDGHDQVDDTLRLTFLDDGIPTPDVIALAVDGRTYGLYDVESTEGAPDFDEMTLFGRADRYFEDTLYRLQSSLLAQAVQRIREAPYNAWGVSDAIEARLDIFLKSARSLGDLRRELARYALTVTPFRVTNFGDFNRANDLRYLRVDTLYPTEETRRRVDARLVASGARYKIADHFNRPGRFAQRPIVAGYRAPTTGLVEVLVDPPSANVRAGDRLKLDIEKISEEPAGFVIQSERWRLQNTSATASVTLTEGDLSIRPQMLLDFTLYADSGLPRFADASHIWRVTAVVHKGEGDAYETRLDLALWQGSPD